jgi:hypothetical protein
MKFGGTWAGARGGVACLSLALVLRAFRMMIGSQIL